MSDDGRPGSNAARLKPISFKRHRFPQDLICYAVWLYFRFTLSVRDVEELLAERGIEAVRCWAIKFGPEIASNLRRRRGVPTSRWHLDEMVVKIDGQRMYLWRAVDDEVLDMLVQKRRNRTAATKLLRRLLGNCGVHPETITTDKLASYRAALRDLGLASRDRPGGMRENTGPRTATLPSDENESSRSSSGKARPRDSSPLTLRSTTRSISSLT